MPTLNKLEYLDETKQQIKNALNTNFNSQIQDTDTFRSYVSKINDIYTNWPKVTGEDTTLSLIPTKKGLMKVELKGNTSQDGTPTPDTPIPIKVVTGEQNVKIQNKNLYDKSKVSTYTFRTTATINNDKSVTITATGSSPHYCIISPYVFLEANTTYRISYDVDNMSGFDHMQMFVSSSTTAGGYSNTNSVTYTPSVSRGVALGVYLKANATITISNIQIEKGNTTTSYVPYQSQTYSLSLGNIELARIDNYKDYIFKNVTGSPYYNANLDLNGWYLYKIIDKLTLNGSETYIYQSNYARFLYAHNISNLSIGDVNKSLCNYFIYGTQNNNFFINNTYLYFYANDYTSADNFKNFVQEKYENGNALTVYVPLATPTNTKITDTTLISQLENINNNSRSYKDTTIIECSSASTDNEVIVANVSALMKGV